ncbi:MAG: plastocyanin/azurin family copper-binding protein [Acidimicrobiia bacterium]
MGSRIMRGVAASTFAVLGLVVVAPAAGATDTRVSVDDNFFKPKKVAVEVGDKVTWKWDGFVAHNVVVEKGPQKFKSRTQAEGKFSRVIKKPGTYKIVCTLHPGMTMKIVATEPVPEPSPTTPPTAPPAT